MKKHLRLYHLFLLKNNTTQTIAITVIAISLATNNSWDSTYIQLSEYARSQGITFSEIAFINDYLSERYEKYCYNKIYDNYR